MKIVLEDVDRMLYDRLKARAFENGRSLAREIKFMLVTVIDRERFISKEDK